MRKLIEMGNQYVKESDWKVIAILKMCLLSMGIMIGTAVPKKQKKLVFALCIPVFITTYVPLMIKLYNVVKENGDR
ncbi:MAG: permease of phosphate ABC transporter [Lachnospiraceae bacterium]|nr:permease of phosphate ABC transporter [Lachnospiraceae bacterium]